MKRCTTRHRRTVKRSGDCPPRTQRFGDLNSIVSDYIESWRDDAEEELEHLRNQPNLHSAIRVAALAINRYGNKHEHQWRIPPATLKVWRSELSREAHSIQSCEDFEGLMHIAEGVARGIWGIGELTLFTFDNPALCFRSHSPPHAAIPIDARRRH